MSWCPSAEVAIKHINKALVTYQSVLLNGELHCAPLEMILMVMTAGDSGGNAVVSPLAWTDLDDEVLLIMERPENCMNLFEYNNGQIDEGLAKEFMRQLVEAAIQIHEAGVFHGDLKLENILIQFYDAWRIPRVRIVDFGCGCFVMPGYRSYAEFNHQGTYETGPTTVWHSLTHFLPLVPPLRVAGGLEPIPAQGAEAGYTLDWTPEFMRQLVEAAIQIHKAGIFYSDLQLENILIQFYDAWRIPRVRIIDFGCGCFVTPGYHSYAGTFCFRPPEFNHQGTYETGPTTVWQLGSILLELLSENTDLFTTGMQHCENFLTQTIKKVKVSEGKKMLLLLFFINILQLCELVINECSFRANGHFSLRLPSSDISQYLRK
ncbi:hypothetical protein D4764_04G0013930 [Takifugu flavidus]|uniref:non-specific serine/threonine protein kinase n=1 Tax=Takifugu flavidus TaxID=433684 RepID=A0A5C6N601_9TELE|nr:hypothetical protein D4764_04G0013930 [Takifugu flavidus]